MTASFPSRVYKRASRIELIQKTEFFSLYIQGWTTQIPLTSTHHCSISQQHISQVLIIFSPCVVLSTQTSTNWAFVGLESEQRHHLLRGIFFYQSRSASLIAKPQKAFQTNAASYQIWLAVYCVPWTRLISCGWSACILFSFFHIMIFKWRKKGQSRSSCALIWSFILYMHQYCGMYLGLKAFWPVQWITYHFYPHKL